jgi:hypothetical protein
MSDRPNVFTCETPQEVFSRWLAWLGPHESLTQRALGDRVGLSHGHLGLVLRGERPLPAAKEWSALVEALGFHPDEALFIRRLDDALRARSAPARAEASRRVEAQRSAHLAAQAAASLFEHWYLPAIAELLQSPGAPTTPEAIAAALQPPVSPDEVLTACAQLRALAGRPARLSAGDAPAVPPLREFHRATLTLAAQATATLPAHERECQSFTGAISAATLERLRARMREDVAGWMHLCEQEDGPRDRVVQVNAVAFPVASWVPDVR